MATLTINPQRQITLDGPQRRLQVHRETNSRSDCKDPGSAKRGPRPRTIEAGIEVLAVVGDFADGVIAYEGRRPGAEIFISFDREAVTILKQQGHPALLLS